MCGVLNQHRFVLTSGGRIKCEKCWGMWELDGRELIPLGYQSWTDWRDECAQRNLGITTTPEIRLSGENPLPPRVVARILVEELITRNHLQNRAEINALREEASESPDVFIENMLGLSQS